MRMCQSEMKSLRDPLWIIGMKESLQIERKPYETVKKGGGRTSDATNNGCIKLLELNGIEMNLGIQPCTMKHQTIGKVNDPQWQVQWMNLDEAIHKNLRHVGMHQGNNKFHGHWDWAWSETEKYSGRWRST